MVCRNKERELSKLGTILSTQPPLPRTLGPKKLRCTSQESDEEVDGTDNVFLLAGSGRAHLELLTESHAQGRDGSQEAHPGAIGLKKGCVLGLRGESCPEGRGGRPQEVSGVHWYLPQKERVPHAIDRSL